jgi:hypothetical protein
MAAAAVSAERNPNERSPGDDEQIVKEHENRELYEFALGGHGMFQITGFVARFKRSFGRI